MRILFLSSQLPHASVAGGHMIVYQRMMRLARRGHEIGLATFCSSGDRHRAELIKDMLLELELVETPSAPSIGRCVRDYFFCSVPPWYWRVRNETMRRCVGDMVERSQYDVVVAEFGIMGQHLFWNPYLPAVRRVISVHHSGTLSARRKMDLLGPTPRAVAELFHIKGLRRFEFAMYGSADHVLVLSSQDRYKLLSEAPSLRIAVVPSGVDVGYFKPSEEVTKEPCILFTGHYTDQANSDAAIWFATQVWPRIRDKNPELKFHIVGPEPTPAMWGLTTKDPRVVVKGRVDDLRACFEKAAVFVCPVRMGAGMRSKVLEAMASGVPVVSTTLGVEGIPAQMGDNCLIADQPDIMAQQIDLLLSDENLRTTMAENARTMVTERFSWERSLSHLESIFSELPKRY